MLEFIIKYWVEFIFGLIVASGGIFFKRFWALSKADHKREQTEFFNKIREDVSKVYDKSKEDDEKMQSEIDNLKTSVDCLKRGMLSIQGKQFRQECVSLLEEDHEITLEEFQDLDEEHEIYNSLGGNHRGDHLFCLVTKKFEKIL